MCKRYLVNRNPHLDDFDESEWRRERERERERERGMRSASPIGFSGNFLRIRVCTSSGCGRGALSLACGIQDRILQRGYGDSIIP